MAWIVKNSAGQQIDRRDEPYLDESFKADLESQVMSKYPTRRAGLLPVLHAVQHKHDWIPYQALEEVAEFIGLTASEVLDTASFYEDFRFEPKGRYLVMVCQSISCELMGQVGLLDKIKAKLGIEVGETTDDGKFTLATAECLGSCGTAPCALVNETLHEGLTQENFERVLDEL